MYSNLFFHLTVFVCVWQVLGLASTQVGDTVVRRGLVHCVQLLKLNLSRTRITDHGEVTHIKPADSLYISMNMYLHVGTSGT